MDIINKRKEKNQPLNQSSIKNGNDSEPQPTLQNAVYKMEIANTKNGINFLTYTIMNTWKLKTT